MRISKRMEESCKACKKWQNHLYWNHMEPTNVKFFMKMEASFKRYLNLPRKLANNFRGNLSNIIKLKVPSGKTWQIKVLKSDNSLSLRSGWRDFVTANKIDENDSLLFKSSGSSSFDVLVFDPSGNEKAPFPSIKIEESESESETEMDMKSESESESETDKTSSDSDNSICIFIPSKKIKSENETSSTYIRRGNERGSNGDQSRSIHASKQMKQALSEKPYHVPQATELSVEQQMIADKLASATQPGSKRFLKILCPTDLRHYLAIPRCFATENIEKRNHSISLQVANKRKVFSARYQYSEEKPFIGRGWKTFALENNLKVGNLYLFEVKNSDSAGQLAIVVHIPVGSNQ